MALHMALYTPQIKTTLAWADEESSSMAQSSLPSSASEMEDNNIVPPLLSTGDLAPPKTLVLCFDGTGDQFDSDNSNVVKFFSLLKRDNPREQMVYYQTGIGTYTSPQLVTSVGRAVSKTLDKMVAWNLDAHVMSGYKFLMQTYAAGDKICLFGFSRGAYIASALAGMLHKVGLLPPWNIQQVPFAYKMYKSGGDDQDLQRKEFKNHFSIHVDIDFIGVWDTVASVGIIPRWLPMAVSNTAIRVFRHALSLDERRAKFEVHHFQRFTDEERYDELRWDLIRESTAATRMTAVAASADEMKLIKEHFARKTDVKEVWFAGCHCDVGGGSVLNTERSSLARIPLRWMIREVFRTNTGIRFDLRLLEDIGFNSASLWLHANPAGPNSDTPVPEVDGDEEHWDALCPTYDQLRLKPWWWILEVVPSKQRDGKKWRKYTLNLGRGRTVPQQPETNEVYIHRTVKMRQDERDLPWGSYKPKATWGDLRPIYVD